MASISKACLELSNSIRGFRLGRSASDNVAVTSSINTPTTTPGGGSKDVFVSKASLSVTTTITRAIKSATSRVKAFDRNQTLPPATATQQQQDGEAEVNAGRCCNENGNFICHSTSGCRENCRHACSRESRQRQVWDDDDFLYRFFWYFSARERCILSQVCRRWKRLLYSPRYWRAVTPILHCREFHSDEEYKRKFYENIEQRQFDSLCLFGSTDADIEEVVSNFPYCRSNIRSLALRCSNITDAGLEKIMEQATSTVVLELSGCNEITEAGLWSCLNPRLVSLSISDCINVADDSVGAIAQLLPALQELNLQAYHVTDASLSFFSAKQSYTLTILRLQSCWEITNHGLVNVIHSLPNLTVLSLSGCSKITDDGVELIAENLRKLTSLDLSWCPRLTDAALEYIACDLAQLEELRLDR